MIYKDDYAYSEVIRPLIIENKTHVNLGEIIKNFNMIYDIQESANTSNQTYADLGEIGSTKRYIREPKNSIQFLQALRMALNSLGADKQIVMCRTPQSDIEYNYLTQALMGPVSEKYLRDKVHPYMERMHIENIITDLDLKIPPKFVEKYLMQNNPNFSEFKEDLLEEKNSNGRKTSLWITTNFTGPEITDYFKVANDLGFFDKIVVLDNFSYAFVLDTERLKNQKYSLCSMANFIGYGL